MSKADKILTRMRQNSRDWRTESVKTVAQTYGIKWRQKGTSHVVFIKSDGKTLPIPARRPIKSI